MNHASLDRSDGNSRAEFLTTLAHELRNPLAPLANGLRIIRMMKNDPAEIERTLDVVDRQLQHLVRLIDALLDAAQVNDGQVKLSRERVSLASILEQAARTARPVLEAGQHRLGLPVLKEPVFLEGDARRLAQVFASLLDNAAKYSGPGAPVQLFVERTEQEVTVSIVDEGIGIAPELLERVFELFAKADRSLEKGQDGLGLGLSTARRLVELHGGTVEARSAGPGTGATLVVKLPALAPAEADAPPATRGDVDGIRILIVDDNRDFVSSLAVMLKIMGHQTSEAYDGMDALRVAAAFHPEIVLLDIGMPKLNGYDACQVIREQPWGRDAVLVALTGWGREEDVARAREVGFDHHLVKPFDSDALEKIINSVRQAA